MSTICCMEMVVRRIQEIVYLETTRTSATLRFKLG